MQPNPRPGTKGLVAVATVLAIALGACSDAGRSDPPGAAVAPAPTASPRPTTVAPANQAPTSSDAWLAVGRRGAPGLEVILAGTMEQFYDLPLGVPDDLWGHLVATTQAGPETTVNEITVQPDMPAVSRSIPGAWHLPTVGADTLPVGVSASGSTIILVEDAAMVGASTTRFAVLVRGSDARILELPGSLEFDALSHDGSILYVVEHLPGPPAAHYQVRSVDTATGRMRPEVIVDKRNLNEAMGGQPITQVRHDNGVAFTLYRGVEHPFIHALNTTEAWAVCLDLPATGADDADAARDWGLAISPDGASVFAVNATLGLASDIDPDELTVRRSASFEAPQAAVAITLAKFGHQESGPIGRRAVVSPDGASLYAAGSGGIVRLETDRLTRTGTIFEGAAVDALALTPDGSTLYALLVDGGRIVKLDAGTGKVLGEVAGGGFDRLVAVVPW